MNDLTRLIDAGAKIGVPDRTGFDQIDVAAKKLFQGLGQTEKLAHGAKAATRLEIDKEVGVATHGVEVSVTRGRVKYLQTPHRVTAAQYAAPRNGGTIGRFRRGAARSTGA